MGYLVFGAVLVFILERLWDDPETDPEPIEGTDGPDTLTGTSGRDILIGGQGSDRLFALGGDDDLFGGAGQDYLSGGDGNDHLTGQTGADQLEGGAGNDILDSRTDDDTDPGIFSLDALYGGSGDDWLIAGGSGELLVGDDGADIFDLGDTATTGIPRLVDYTPGVDLVVLRYDPALTPEPSFEITPDAAGQNFEIQLNGGYVGIIEGEFGIDYDDFVLLPYGAPIPVRPAA